MYAYTIYFDFWARFFKKDLGKYFLGKNCLGGFFLLLYNKKLCHTLY